MNIITEDVAGLTAFYKRVMGFEVGDRPPFTVDGAWLYCKDVPVVHLVQADRQPVANEPQIEHFAFTASGLSEFLDHLRSLRIPYDILVTPNAGNRQVNVRDPDGNHFEVIFGPHEQADLEAYEGN